MSLGRFLLRRAARLIGVPIHRRIARFERACLDPQAVQERLLLDIVRRQAPTSFGQDHGFATIRTVADYRRQVPVAPYEYVAPYVERAARGETQALIAQDKILLFALTSGTTAARKLIPVTTRYLTDYRRGWNFWGARCYRDHRPRKLFLRPIVQMVGDPQEYLSPCGVPCGNLSGYTALVQKRVIRWLYAVPPLSGKVKDARSRYYLALRCAIGRPCSMFLAANPSTLVMLGRTLETHADSLLRDLADGTLASDLMIPDDVRAALPRWKPNPTRARELVAIASQAGQLRPKQVWPDDATLIGAWTGGSMGPYLRQLPDYFGTPALRDLGLLASEGRMTIPFANGTPSGVLDIASHYFEFLPEAEADSSTPRILGAHELEVGQSYFIIPTTQSGLYRYQISDLIRVTGFFGRTPEIEFVGKGNRFANLTGEKLSETQVLRGAEEAASRTGYAPMGYSLAPVWDEQQPYYGFFSEVAVPAGFLVELDAALARLNIEYAAKREGNRLGAIRAVQLPAGFWVNWDAERLRQTGGSPEQYKHPALIGDLAFAEPLIRPNGGIERLP